MDLFLCQIIVNLKFFLFGGKGCFLPGAEGDEISDRVPPEAALRIDPANPPGLFIVESIAVPQVKVHHPAGNVPEQLFMLVNQADERFSVRCVMAKTVTVGHQPERHLFQGLIPGILEPRLDIAVPVVGDPVYFREHGDLLFLNCLIFVIGQAGLPQGFSGHHLHDKTVAFDDFL